VGSKHGIAHIIGRLISLIIKDVDSPLADVEDTLFSHFFDSQFTFASELPVVWGLGLASL